MLFCITENNQNLQVTIRALRNVISVSKHNKYFRLWAPPLLFLYILKMLSPVVPYRYMHIHIEREYECSLSLTYIWCHVSLALRTYLTEKREEEEEKRWMTN